MLGRRGRGRRRAGAAGLHEPGRAEFGRRLRLGRLGRGRILKLQDRKMRANTWL
jgi:hypothetical protein